MSKKSMPERPARIPPGARRRKLANEWRGGPQELPFSCGVHQGSCECPLNPCRNQNKPLVSKNIILVLRGVVNRASLLFARFHIIKISLKLKLRIYCTQPWVLKSPLLWSRRWPGLRKALASLGLSRMASCSRLKSAPSSNNPSLVHFWF